MDQNLISVFFIFLIFLVGLVLAKITAKQIHNSITYILFFEHMFFSFFYYLYSLSHSADSNMYYARALSQNDLFSAFGSDTQFIIFITTFFAKYLSLSKLAVFFVFGFFGYVGFLYFIKMLNRSQMKFLGINVPLLILLLPGFHFWTSALGKDSLIFMFLMMFFYGISNFKRHFLLVLFSIIGVGLIRPHIGFIILISVNLAIVLQNPGKFRFSYLFILLLSLFGLIISLPFVVNFLSIDKLDYETINNRLEFYSQYSAQEAGGLNSYVDVSSYSLPLKMLSYFFRPLFFDVHSILQLLASFENLFLIILLFKWLKAINFRIIRWYKSLKLNEQIMFLYVIIGWIILAAGMYNLGLAYRQKYMLLPVLFILMFRHVVYNKRFKKINRTVES